MTLTDQLNYFTASEAAPTDTEASQPVVQASSVWVNSLAVNWDHPFTEAFSMRLVAGATQTLSPGAATFMQVQPTGSAALTYNFLLATAGLSYAHMAQPNVSTGTVSFTDAVSLRFSAPLGLTGLNHQRHGGVHLSAVPIGTPIVACPSDMPTCVALPHPHQPLGRVRRRPRPRLPPRAGADPHPRPPRPALAPGDDRGHHQARSPAIPSPST